MHEMPGVAYRVRSSACKTGEPGRRRSMNGGVNPDQRHAAHVTTPSASHLEGGT
jgi:hypothetical protein